MKCWPVLICFGMLGGCTVVRKSEATPPPQSATGQPAPLDKENVHLAEKTVPMGRLGQVLRVVAKFDKHSEWTDAYIKETLTAASFLKQNDQLRGEMLATLNGESAIVEVSIIRVEEDRFGVRVQCSQQQMTNAVQAEFDQI